MPKRLVTEFEAWDFTPEELLQAKVYNELQFKYLQTEMAIAAQEKLSTRADEGNPEVFIRDQMYLSGKLDALKMLIGNHLDSLAALEQLALDVQIRRAQAGDAPETQNHELRS